MKRYLIIFGILIIALLAAALVIPSFLDWNKYRAEIEGVAEAATGRDVAIDGDISFAVLPMPALTAEKITLSNLSEGIARDMVTLDELSVRVGLWPLLLGRVEVRSVALVRPVIALEVLPDGRKNWDFTETQAKPADGGGRDVQLDHFSIKDGTLTYEDMRSGSRQVVRQINMTVAAESLKGPMSLKGGLVWRDTPLKLDARMGSQDGNAHAPVSGEVQVGGAKIKINGVAGMGEAMSLSGKIAVATDDMTPLLAAIHTLTEGEGEPQVLSLPLNVESDVSYGGDALSLDNLRLALGETKATGALKVKLGETTAVDAALAVSVLDMDELVAALPEKKEETEFHPKDILQYLNDLKLTGQVALSAEAVRYRGRVVREAGLKLTADGKTIDLAQLRALLPGSSELTASARFDRQPSPVINGKLNVNSGSLRGLLEWLDMVPPDVAQSRLQAFSLSSGVRLMGNIASADNLALKLDTMTAKGSARYINGAPPRLDADLDIDRLDLTGYVPADTCAFGTDAKPADPAAKPAAKSEPAAFGLAMKARVGKLVCGKLAGQNLVLDVAQSGDTLTLYKVEAVSLAGLALNVSGKLAGQGDKMTYALKGNVSGKSLAEAERVAPGMLPLPPAALKAGPVAMTFAVNGGPQRIEFDGQGAVGGTKLQGQGHLVPESPGKEGFKSLDTNFAVSAASLAGLIQQWELGLTPPQPADDKPLSLSGTLKGPASAMAVDVNGTIASAAVTVTGAVRQAAEATSYDLKTRIDGKDARAFVRGLGVEFGDGVEGMGPILLTGGVVGNDQSVSLNGLAGQFGPVKLNGAATVKLGEPRPSITGDFRAGDIPADRFMRPAPEEKKGVAKTAVKHEWSKEPFDTAFLSSFDANVKFRADSLTVKGYKFDQPKFTLLVQNGQLQVDGLTGKLFDGDVSLNFAFGGTAQNPMSLKFDVRNASMVKALQTAANISAVTGTMNLSGSFNGAGASPYDLVRSLSGGADLSLSDGIVKGIDMPRLSKGLTSLRDNGSLGSLLSGALAGGQTKHKGFAGHINSDKGVLNLSNMVVELDAAKALLGATVDLPKWTVNSAGRLQLSEHPETPAIGVGITGLLDAPTVAYDTKAFKKQMEAQIARAVLQSVTSGGGLNQLLGRPTAPEGTTPEGQTATQPAQPSETTEPAKPKDPGKLLLDQFLKSIDKKKQQGDGQPQ